MTGEVGLRKYPKKTPPRNRDYGAQTEAAAFPQSGTGPFRIFFDDLRLRYGIKLGLAAVLALLSTQILRLEHASWAILTVLVMMSSQYVGSIAVKAIMRAAGTIVGAG